MKRRNADPAFAAAVRERITQLHANPDFAAKHAAAASRALKRLNADPEFREASRQRMRRMQAERHDAANEQGSRRKPIVQRQPPQD
jgi:hypothetical protein